MRRMQGDLEMALPRGLLGANHHTQKCGNVLARSLYQSCTLVSRMRILSELGLANCPPLIVSLHQKLLLDTAIDSSYMPNADVSLAN